MNVFSLYQLSDGLFTGHSIAAPAHLLADNVPENNGCIVGEYDYLSQKVDLATGEVADYIPEQPGADYVWDADIKRWQYVRTLSDHQTARLELINGQCAALLDRVRQGYSADEVQSWSKQEAEARAFVLDASAPAPLIRALALAREVPLADLVGRIIMKSDLFAAVSGQLIGNRQRCEDQIAGAETIDAVEAITW